MGHLLDGKIAACNLLTPAPCPDVHLVPTFIADVRSEVCFAPSMSDIHDQGAFTQKQTFDRIPRRK